MLILTRRVGQSLLIMPGPAVDPATPVGELFQRGPLEISFQTISGARVKLAVAADRRLLILRKELYRES